MKYLLLTGALLLSSMPASALAAEKWDYQQEVSYQEYHDPLMVWLSDGRKLAVSLGTIKFEEIDAWKRGRKLSLVYQSGAGVALLDIQSGKKLPVLSGWQKHPIEHLQNLCIDKNPSTLGMVDCTQLASKRWDAELNFAYGKLQKQLSADGKESLKLAQRQWLKFRDEQTKAIQAIYRERDGTIWQTVAAQSLLELNKEQALRLMSFIEQENP